MLPLHLQMSENARVQSYHAICVLPLTAIFNRHIIPRRCAVVNLAWPGNFGRPVFVHFLLLGNPTGQASECKNDGEHVFGNSDRPVDDAAVEIDVGIEFLIYEIIV